MAPRGSRLLKSVDRWGGIPAVWLLGHARRRRRPVPQRLARIGVLKTNAIGDTVLLAGAVADLRAAIPGAHIVLFAGSNNLAMARLLDEPDQVAHLPLDRPARCVAALRRERLDALLDFGSWPRVNAVLSALSGARFIAGFHADGQHRHYVYDAVVMHSPAVHEIENYRHLVQTLGVPTGCRPELSAPDIVEPIGEPFAVFHPWPGGAGRALKQWPQARWVDLAVAVENQGKAVVITGGPQDVDDSTSLVAACGAKGLQGVRSLAGQIDLSQTVALLARADLAVCVNTGVMHIAAALDVPLVALHGPTAVHRWGPCSSSAVSVTPDIPGCGYLHLGFEYPPSPPPCMESIAVEQVLRAMQEAVGS